MTHSFWGGWHHVEVHEDSWWILKMTAMGFVYSDFLTNQIRSKGKEDRWLDFTNPRNESDKKSFHTGQHIGMSMLVRIVLRSTFFPASGSFVFSSHMELYLKYYCFLINCFAFRYSSILMLRLGQSTRICLLR
jgi:hypothetical protein